MKTIEINLYSIGELSEEAKERALQDWLGDGFEYFWDEDNRKSLSEFEKIFPVKVKDYSYGGQGYYISFEFLETNEIENLSGIRLLKYLWNNYKTYLYKGAYKSVKSGKKIYHKRVKSKVLSNGKIFNAYYSAIKLDNCCPLTGYYMDDNLLLPIYDFMKRPCNSMTFYDLMDNCLDNWIKDANEDYEYSISMESFIDTCQANDWTFTGDGKIKNY